MHKAYRTESRAIRVLLAQPRQAELHAKARDLARNCANRRERNFVRLVTSRAISREREERFHLGMPSSTTQPITIFREPVHFPLMTNGRCAVTNKISSSEYEGRNGQQPVNGTVVASATQSLKQK